MSTTETNKARHRIIELTQEIRDHQFKYYVLDAPSITDQILEIRDSGVQVFD